MITFNNVSKTYATGVEANHKISFDVNKGEVVGIVGPNGSGKTTLLRQLFKILTISEGEILIDGKEDYLDLVAYVPQFAAIYPGLTVFETIYITFKYQGYKKSEAKKMAEEVIKNLEMEQMKNQFSYTLSGGQSKLLAFACALVQNKPYLILDEVTSMVDILTKEKIWDLIEKNKENKGILIASHDMGEIKRLCDKMIVLKEGKVVYMGKPSEVGTEFCKAEMVIENIDKIIELLDNEDVDYIINNNKVNIVTKNIEEMFRILNMIKNISNIKGFQCEHPAFYEGVLSIVKNN